MITKSIFSNIIILVISSTLFSCGGSDTKTVENKAPQAAIISPSSVLSFDNVELNASSSYDPDGEITSYSWQQIAGNTVTLSSQDTAVITFIAPQVSNQTIITFKLTVTDTSGATGISSIDIQIVPNTFDVSVNFPASGSRFLGDKISVSGTLIATTVNNTPIDAEVTVTSEQIETLAQVNADGSWVVNDVPVTKGKLVKFSITAVDNLRSRDTTNNISFESQGIHFSNALMDTDDGNANIIYAFSPGPGKSQLIRIHLDTGRTTLIYSEDHGPDNLIAYTDEVEYNPINKTLFLLTNTTQGVAIYGINTVSGELNLIANNDIGEGPLFNSYSWVTMAIDSTHGTIFLADQKYKKIYSIESETGNRAVIADNGSIGDGAPMVIPRKMVMDEANNLLYVYGNNQLLKIAVNHGTRTIIPYENNGSTYLSLNAMVFNANNNEIAITNNNNISLINLESGNSVKLSTIDSFNSSKWFKQILFDKQQQRYLLNDFGFGYQSSPDSDSIIAIDRKSGEHSIIFDDRVGDGPYLGHPGDMVTDNENNFSYVIDSNRHALIKIDLNTGQRQVIHKFKLNVEPNKYSARSLSFNKENNTMYVAASRSVYIGNNAFENFYTITAIDLTTGLEKEIANENTGTGSLKFGTNITLNIEQNIIYTASYEDDLVARIDLSTLERTILSDAQHGAGVDIEHPIAVKFDQENNRLILFCEGTGATETITVFSIDIATGDRSLIYDYTKGTGPWINVPQALAVSADGTTAYTFSDFNKIVALDMTTGNRKDITGANIGNGETISGVRALALSADGKLLYMSTYSLGAILLIDTNTGDSVILSK
ncbi:MAG: hypothetical protein MJK15_10270 [Colwellia sp.]|nr:hypothetical protein [Colwellia sp.]